MSNLAAVVILGALRQTYASILMKEQDQWLMLL
jgi:hypothetical protein